MKFNIRVLYLYLFSFVGLLIVVFGSISLIELGLKTFVFKEASVYKTYVDQMGPVEKTPIISQEELDRRALEQSNRDKQMQLANAIAMIAVGTPLYLYHWKKIQKEKV